jgi:ATP-binding cassette subfamily B protein
VALVSFVLLPFYLWVARRSALRMKTNLNRTTREEERLKTGSQHAYGVYLNRLSTAQRFYFSQSVLSNLSKSMVLGYGGFLVLPYRLTPGDVVMFVAYLDRLYSPIEALNEIAVRLQQHIASLLRSVRLLDAGRTEKAGADLPPGPGRVEFRNVRFGYIRDAKNFAG